MRAFLLATALALPLAAQAQNVQNNNRNSLYNGGTTNNNRIDIYQAPTTNNNRNDNYVRADGGNARAENNVRIDGAGSGGNASTSYNERLQAPGLASYAAPSGPCVGVSTFATGSIAGFGIGGGRSEIEAECPLREAARLMHAFGATGEALELVRNLPSVVAARAATVPPAPRAVTITPLPVIAVPVVPPPKPEWCWTLSGPEINRFRSQCE